MDWHHQCCTDLEQGLCLPTHGPIPQMGLVVSSNPSFLVQKLWISIFHFLEIFLLTSSCICRSWYVKAPIKRTISLLMYINPTVPLLVSVSLTMVVPIDRVIRGIFRSACASKSIFVNAGLHIFFSSPPRAQENILYVLTYLNRIWGNHCWREFSLPFHYISLPQS